MSGSSLPSEAELPEDLGFTALFASPIPLLGPEQLGPAPTAPAPRAAVDGGPIDWAAQPAAAATVTTGELPAAAAPIVAGHVLVVDDDAEHREVLGRRLRRLGLDVHAVSDGAAALAHVARHPTDLVLLDLALRGMSGEAVLERLKADPAQRDVPVLVTSPADDLRAAARCIALGADDHLAWPFDPVLLRARVSAALDRKRLRDAERARTQAMERELEIGRAIQGGFLPAELPRIAGWEIAATSEPARQVSGDFYDAFPIGELRYGVVVGDVCGKGVGASLFMALFRTLIRAVATQVVRSGRTSPGSESARLAAALEVANDYIAETHGDANMFATVFAASFDPLTGALHWMNAGHDPALVLDRAGRVRAELAPGGPALGLFPDIALAVGREQLAPGETLLVTTDGIGEARDRTGAFFGDERLRVLCAEHGAGPSGGARALVRQVVDAVHAFADGAEPADDLTLLALRRDDVAPWAAGGR